MFSSKGVTSHSEEYYKIFFDYMETKTENVGL